MSKFSTEQEVKISYDAVQARAEMQKLKVQSDAVSRSLTTLDKRTRTNSKAANDAVTAEKNITAARTAHAASIRNVSSNLATMTGPLNAVTGRISAFGAMVSRVGLSTAAFGAAFAGLAFTLVAALKNTIGASIDAEGRYLKLGATLTATGYAAGFTRTELEGLTKQVAADTLASIEGVSSAVTALSSFKKVNGDNFERTIRLGQSLATVYKQDLTTSVRRLGIALQDPLAKYASLERVGVNLSDQQIANIKQLQEQGNLFAAQAIILDEIDSKVGGVGEKAGQGLEGAFDLLSQRGQEFFEAISNIGRAPGEVQGSISKGISYIVNGMAGELDYVSKLIIQDIDEVKAELAEFANLKSFGIASFDNIRTGLEDSRDALESFIAKRKELGETEGSYSDESAQLAAVNKLLAGQELNLQEKVKVLAVSNKEAEKGHVITLRNSDAMSEYLAKYNELTARVKEFNDEKAKAVEGKISGDDDIEKQAEAEALIKNKALYEKLFASVGEGYEKQRRQQKRIHNEKLKQIDDIEFKDSEVVNLGLDGIATNEQLKAQLKIDAAEYVKNKLSEIDTKEENKRVADLNRERRAVEEKRKIETQFTEFQNVNRGIQASEADKWQSTQLEKLATFKARMLAAEGVDIDTSAEEAAINAEADLKRLEEVRQFNEQKRAIELEFTEFQNANRGIQSDEISKWQAEQLVKLAKFKADSLDAGISLDTSAEEDAINAEAEVLRAKQVADTKRAIELEHALLKASLTDSAFDDIDAKYQLDLEKLREQLENKFLLEEEYVLRKQELDENARIAKEQAENDELVSRAGGQAEFTKAMIQLKEGEAQAGENIAKATADNLSKTSKKAFAIKKAMAIKEALIATYQNAVMAFQAMSGIPIVGPVLGAVAAAGAIAFGMAQINQIRSQQYTGARRTGGGVTRSRSYLVGEDGPEIATFGANAQITSFQNAQKAFGVKPGQPQDQVQSQGDTHISIQALDARSVRDLLMDDDTGLIDAIGEKMAESGKVF